LIREQFHDTCKFIQDSGPCSNVAAVQFLNHLEGQQLNF